MSDLQAAWAAIDDVVRQQMEADNTPGLALAVTDRERTVRIAAYGYADIALRTPVIPETRFQIGSIGKSFTAIALLQLAEEGVIDLQAPVRHYLPWFETPDAGEPITLHHLLSHTAGITAGTDFSPEARFQVWALRHARVTCPPGATFHYSNAGYKALGLVLEAVSGQPYGDVIQQRILGPLGMAASLPVITHDARLRLATGYQPLHDDRPPHRRDPLVPAPWIETDTGDGSIISTPEDMASYARMLLREGAPLLSPTGFAHLTRRVTETASGETPSFYGYGLTTRIADGHVQHGHGGGMIGYFAMLLVDQDAGLGVVALVNGPGSPGRIARAIMPLVQAASQGRPFPEPAAGDSAGIEHAAEYAGTFVSGGKTLDLIAEGPEIRLRHGTEQITLEPADDDAFFVDHPAFNRFLLRFERDEVGGVVAATHGPDWYAREGRPVPEAIAYPPEWDAYPGHYRSHNPWAPNFRVVLRRGRLWLIFPVAPDGFDDEQPLSPLASDLFQAAGEGCRPEWLAFDTVVDGRALRANLSGGDYYRVFTP